MSVGVVGRCEQCGIGYEVVGVEALDTEAEVTCRDCGGPVYAVAAVVEGIAPLIDDETVPDDPYDCAACLAGGDVCQWHEGWAAGWDACARVVAHVRHRGLEEAA